MLKQRLQQKLLQKLSPQQIQLIKLLEVPTIQLEQRIKKEIEENPVLEEGRELDSDLSGEDQNDGQEDKDSNNIPKITNERYLGSKLWVHDASHTHAHGNTDHLTSNVCGRKHHTDYKGQYCAKSDFCSNKKAIIKGCRWKSFRGNLDNRNQNKGQNHGEQNFDLGGDSR